VSGTPAVFGFGADCWKRCTFDQGFLLSFCTNETLQSEWNFKKAHSGRFTTWHFGKCQGLAPNFFYITLFSSRKKNKKTWFQPEIGAKHDLMKIVKCPRLVNPTLRTLT